MIRRRDFGFPLDGVKIIPAESRVGDGLAEQFVDCNGGFVQGSAHNLIRCVYFFICTKIRYAGRFLAAAQMDLSADFVVAV